MTNKEKVFTSLCNHRNCTSGGIANIWGLPRFTVLKELVEDGSVRVQKGRMVDGYPEPRFRSYKLAKEKYTPIPLFE